MKRNRVNNDDVIDIDLEWIVKRYRVDNDNNNNTIRTCQIEKENISSNDIGDIYNSDRLGMNIDDKNPILYDITAPLFRLLLSRVRNDNIEFVNDRKYDDVTIIRYNNNNRLNNATELGWNVKKY